MVATLPALDPPLNLVVLIHQGDWKGVRVGVGPYLVGFVNVALTPGQVPHGGALSGGSHAGPGEVPERLRADNDKPLWRLPAGTRIRFNGVTTAILEQPGFARELHRYNRYHQVDVFAAVDDQVAVRGMVRFEDLQPYQGGSTAPGATAPAGTAPMTGAATMPVPGATAPAAPSTPAPPPAPTAP